MAGLLRGMSWPVCFGLIPTLDSRVMRARRDRDRRGIRAGLGISPYYTAGEHGWLDSGANGCLAQQGLPGAVYRGIYSFAWLQLDSTDELELYGREHPLEVNRVIIDALIDSRAEGLTITYNTSEVLFEIEHRDDDTYDVREVMAQGFCQDKVQDEMEV